MSIDIWKLLLHQNVLDLETSKIKMEFFAFSFFREENWRLIVERRYAASCASLMYKKCNRHGRNAIS